MAIVYGRGKERLVYMIRNDNEIAFAAKWLKVWIGKGN